MRYLWWITLISYHSKTLISHAGLSVYGSKHIWSLGLYRKSEKLVWQRSLSAFRSLAYFVFVSCLFFCLSFCLSVCLCLIVCLFVFVCLSNHYYFLGLDHVKYDMNLPCYVPTILQLELHHLSHLWLQILETYQWIHSTSKRAWRIFMKILARFFKKDVPHWCWEDATL